MLKTLIFVSALLVPAAGTPKENAKKDAEVLQGKWVATAIEQRGKALPAEDVQVSMLTLVIKGDRFEFYTLTREREGKFRLDSAARPHAIDLKRDPDGAEKEASLLGIYELDRDTLRLAVDEGKRPTEFRSKGKDGALVVTFKRVK